MHRDLAAIVQQLEDAQAAVHRLAERTDDAQWTARPAPDAWSISECVAHLTMSTDPYLPSFEAAIHRPGARDGRMPARMRRDITGWLLSSTLEPPARVKVPTAAAFIPDAARPKAEVVAAFDRSQCALIALVREADGVDLTRVKVTSAFNAKMRYSLWSALRITTAHQRRHLWQAERVLERLTGQGA